MDGKPLVSIVVIIELTGLNIAETLCSVLEQDYPEIELVVIANTAHPYSMSEVTTLVRNHRKSNLRSVYLKQNTSVLSPMHLCRQAQEYAAGDSLLIIQSGICFDCPSSLSLLAQQHLNESLPSVTAFPAFYNEKLFSLLGQQIYVPMLHKKTPVEPSLFSLRDPWLFASSITPSIENYSIGEITPFFSIPIKTMNRTHGQKARRFLVSLFAIPSGSKQCNNATEAVYSEILTVHQKALGGIWGLTQSAKIYLSLMFFLLKIIPVLCANNEYDTFLYKHDILARIEALTLPEMKLLFLAQEFTVWPSLDSVFRVCSNDSRFTAQVVYTPFRADNPNAPVPHEILQPFWGIGVPAAPYSSYDLALESPDVVLILKPYDMVPDAFSVPHLEKAVEHLVFVHYALKTSVDAAFYDLHFRLPLSAISYKIVGGTKMYNSLAITQGLRRGENLTEMAHPRIDAVRGTFPHTIPSSWIEKAKGRKVLFYNPNALIDSEGGSSTFFQHSFKLFEHFKTSHDVVLLWRPHPRLKQKSCELGLMCETDWDSLISDLELSENIIVDCEMSYLPALNFSDAMVSDISSLILEFLLLDKPVMLLPPSSGLPENPEPECFACDKGHSIEDIIQFYEKSVLLGCDSFKDIRQTILQQELFLPKKSAGEDIMEMLYNELNDV